MKNNKLKDIAKISIIPFLIYIKLYLSSFEINNKMFSIFSSLFLIISLSIILVISFKEGLIKKIINKYNKEFTALTIFILYFLYNDIIIGLILVIFRINPNNINPFIEQIIYIISLLIFISYIIFTYRKDLIKSLKELKTKYSSYLEVGIPSYILGLGVMLITNFLLIFVFKLNISKNEEGVRNILKVMPIYTVFASCLGAPIIEEIVFRKTLRDCFKNSLFYIFMSGFVFGLLHVVSSYSSITDLLYILPYGALGVSFAYMYYKTKNIFVSMSFHFIHNTLLILIQLMGAR